MTSITLLINSILLRLINIPYFKIRITHILAPINKHKRVLLDVLKNINYSKVIDYGCGEGIFSDCFSPSKYCGYDPAVKKITYAKKKFVNREFRSGIPELCIFDLFFFSNVLHHMNPSQIGSLINEVSRSAKKNAYILILELKPRYQQTSYIYKLILLVEAKIHYSEPRPVNFYARSIQNNGFALIDKKDLGAFYLLLFKK